MKYRIQLDISVDKKQHAVDILNFIENIKTDSYKPSGKEKITCYLHCRYHKCTHDEDNPTPCTDYVDIDFKTDKKIHKKEDK